MPKEETIAYACHKCGVAFGDEPKEHSVTRDFSLWSLQCPDCDTPNILVSFGYVAGPAELKKKATHLYPIKLEKAQPLPSEVPKDVAKDFWEAFMIQNLSPKSSSALSRRLLQRLFHEQLNVKDRDLNTEIDRVINEKHLPSEVQAELHAIRTIGNFGAHPIKSKNTGEITDVEPGEAEWQLQVLRTMFDEVFVKPAVRKKRLADLNKKLAAAGKPQIKT